jgi:putative phosphoesterase
VAVLGNNDSMLEFREVEKAELGGKSFLIHHIVNPRLPSERVVRLLKHSRADFVIFGHSHKVFDETIDGTRFINPGYSGKPRLGLARTVGVLELSNPAHPRFTVHPL